MGLWNGWNANRLWLPTMTTLGYVHIYLALGYFPLFTLDHTHTLAFVVPFHFSVFRGAKKCIIPEYDYTLQEMRRN